MKAPHKTKQYTKTPVDYMGNYRIATTNQEVDQEKFAASPLWCPKCGKGKKSCKASGCKEYVNKQNNETN